VGKSLPAKVNEGHTGNKTNKAKRSLSLSLHITKLTIESSMVHASLSNENCVEEGSGLNEGLSACAMDTCFDGV
jgi:hypothetical protein